MRGLQIGAGFRGYKSGQEGFQTGVAWGISNRGKTRLHRFVLLEIIPCFNKNRVICGKEMRL